MLNYIQKRLIEAEMLSIIRANPNGIDTRKLITDVHTLIASRIPSANRYHISGMLAWIVKSTHHRLLVRKPGGSSIIA